MSGAIVALPMTVEQIAQAIKQMNANERVRLLELVPELQEQETGRRSRREAQTSVAELQSEIDQLLNSRKLAADDPFVGNLSFRDYLALPDQDRESLWAQLAGNNTWLDEDQKKEVQPDALLA
jgi:hypothetical protein